MHRSAVARHSLPPAAAAALGFAVAPPRALQALTMAAASTTFPLPGSCLLPCHRRRSSLCSSASAAASSASAATTALAVEEARRGRKQLSMEPPLYDYLLANVREHPFLRDLREETAAMRGSQMQVSPAQAQLLAMLVQILGAQRCIEVGVFTGYSSLAVALALPESGRLVACERDERCLEVAKRYYQLAGVAHKVGELVFSVMLNSQAFRSTGITSELEQKVHVKHALAVDSLKSLLESGEASSYDFAFVDADKKMYEEYFELLLKLVRVGGLIVMDNVLWYGRVADPLVNDSKTINIRDLNKKLLEDKRVNISMVPIGDGMTICRKLEED